MSETTTETKKVPSIIAGSRPRALVPTDLDQVWRIATAVVRSGLAPKDFTTVEKCVIAILHGLEIGLPPMMALQRIAVINGRPAVWGDAVPGIALATGELEDWQERIDGHGDKMVATCTVKRRGIKTPKTATFSVDDAKRADLWDTRATVKRRDRETGAWKEVPNDSPWYRYPKRMLTMRARVVFRDLFADAFGGLHIAEELITKDITLDANEIKDVSMQAVAPPIAPIVDEGAAEDRMSVSGKPLPERVRQKPVAEGTTNQAPVSATPTGAEIAADEKQNGSAATEGSTCDELLAQLAGCTSKAELAKLVAGHDYRRAVGSLTPDERRRFDAAFSVAEGRLK